MIIKHSAFFYKTLRDFPTDAEILSHKLLLKAGFISKLAAGIYIWQPMGFRCLKKLENIVRKEMNNSGATEVLLPALQPAKLWQESGRWEQYGKELLRLKDRHNADFCLGPTHEEVVVNFFKENVNSYKDLPLAIYQIQNKTRDEIRPRFGIMRSREFLMKDAYSFHSSTDCLDGFYQVMKSAYKNIFESLGLKYAVVDATSGSIGGDASQEFHILADSGEDEVVFSDGSKFDSDFAANIEKAPSYTETAEIEADKEITIVDTPNCYSIEDVADLLNLTATKCLKSMVLKADKQLICVVLRGDQQLSITKVQGFIKCDSLELASKTEIINAIGDIVGSIGPIDLKIPLYVDNFAANVKNFCCGANIKFKHYVNANWNTDEINNNIGDFRTVKSGEPSVDGSGNLIIKRGIEVGHIFKLGTKYSSAMKAFYNDNSGKSAVPFMGCYGIGVSRIIAAATEQLSNEKNLILPRSLAPFDIAFVPINYQKSEKVKDVTDKLVKKLSENYDCFVFDKKARLGAVLNDYDLSGIFCCIVIGERGLENQEVEIICNFKNSKKVVAINHIESYIQTEIFI